jgi:WXG100 family type VII secretion target
MAGQIRMTPEQMRQRAGEVRNEGQTFQDVINKMQNIINILQDEWEGAASRQFAQQFDTLKPSFNEMKQLIDNIGGQLDATANAVEQLDQDIAGKFQI